MTEAQAHVFGAARMVESRTGRPPRLRDIRHWARLRSAGTVHKHLKSLQAKGYLHRDQDGAVVLHPLAPTNLSTRR